MLKNPDGLEYSDCILCQASGGGSHSEAMGSMKYHFIVITPRSTLTQNVCTCYGSINESNASI